MRMLTGVRPAIRLVAAVFAAGVIGLPDVRAQVAPPPPPPEPKPAKFTPPPPRPPRPARPPAPAPEAKHPARPKAPAPIQVPDIPYEPLVKLDGSGKIVRIKGQVDLVALKHNPTIGPRTVERIRPVLTEWKQRLDRMVVDNLDIMAEVDGGLFDRMDLQDENQKVLLNEVFKMLISTSGPNNVLANANALTKTQLDFQRKLVNDYSEALNKEVAAEIKAKVPGEDKDSKQRQVMEVSRFSLTNMSRDALWSYRGLLATAAGLADKVLPGLGLSADEQAQVAGPLKAVRAASTDQQKTEAVKGLLAAMSLTRQRDFMKAVLDARGPATLPELDDAGVKPNGLPPKEDIDEAKAGDSGV